MLHSGGFITLDMTSYALFVVLGGLTLIVGADQSAPGCTGPAVERCDYIEAAKAANSGPDDRPFRPDLGFNVFDQGSSVWVQQSYPADAWVHASAVRIDKKSCRPCEVIFHGHLPPPIDARDYRRGRLIQSTAPEDPVEAAQMRRDLIARGVSPEFDQGTAAERRQGAVTPAGPPS